jgi:hypothetical protein
LRIAKEAIAKSEIPPQQRRNIKVTRLTNYEQELLEIAFLVLAKDMDYEQEDEILQKMNASVSDLREIENKIDETHTRRREKTTRTH